MEHETLQYVGQSLESRCTEKFYKNGGLQEQKENKKILTQAQEPPHILLDNWEVSHWLKHLDIVALV